MRSWHLQQDLESPGLGCSHILAVLSRTVRGTTIPMKDCSYQGDSRALTVTESCEQEDDACSGILAVTRLRLHWSLRVCRSGCASYSWWEQHLQTKPGIRIFIHVCISIIKYIYIYICTATTSCLESKRGLCETRARTGSRK